MNDWIANLPPAAAAYLEGRRLDEVECIISDLPGIARGKAVPASKFARQPYFHLPDSIFYQTITGEWGEAAGDEHGQARHRGPAVKVKSSFVVCHCRSSRCCR